MFLVLSALSALAVSSAEVPLYADDVSRHMTTRGEMNRHYLRSRESRRLAVNMNIPQAVMPKPTLLSNQPVKPMAVVFPQYHRVPENDRLWGEGFTEWTMLKPMPRHVNNITMRFPHEDIGYYDFLDINHRKYMRQMADHFGVYGFAFYHYWFKDHPIMYEPVERMLADGEPNKPFFFCWANEAWTKRWDGSRDEILIDQDYSDVQGNKDHFMYLLQFFKHQNYILVDEKPIFVFYRIEKEDVVTINAIMALWQSMAIENGLKGIHFLRWLGPFGNGIQSPHIKGGIEFEPGYSAAWRTIHSSPSIFPDGKFNADIYAFNNPELVPWAKKQRKTITELYEQAGDMEKIYRTQQFKMYDRDQVWRNVENRVLPDDSLTFLGTFATWNNAPRRNFSNENYPTYPHMYAPDNLVGIQKHLAFMRNKVLNRKSKYFLLTAWNEWNEQSLFEPSDVDGYDALTAVKSAFRVHSGKSIVHFNDDAIAPSQKSTQRYIADLIDHFGHYTHVLTKSLESLAVARPVLVHIHSAENVGAILPQLHRFRDDKIPIFVTVHDFQWLADDPKVIDNTQHMFALADKVIFPSMFAKDAFAHRVTLGENAVVVSPPDVMATHDQLSIPQMKAGKAALHVGYLDFNHDENNPTREFLAVQQAVNQLSANDAATPPLLLHLFGNKQGEGAAVQNAKYEGPQFYKDSQKKLQFLVFANPSMEFYSYELVMAINSGLPIVYIDQGCLKERLGLLKHKRYFPVADLSQLSAGLKSAAAFAVANAGKVPEGIYARSQEVQPSKWYITNYPVEAI